MYWPGEINSPVQYGDIIVELKTDSTLNKYTIRTFTIGMVSAIPVGLCVVHTSLRQTVQLVSSFMLSVTVGVLGAFDSTVVQV